MLWVPGTTASCFRLVPWLAGAGAVVVGDDIALEGDGPGMACGVIKRLTSLGVRGVTLGLGP